MEQLIIQLVSGAGGGIVAGAAMKEQSLGTIYNAIAGIVGGGIGGQLLAAIVPALASGGLDIGSIIGNVVGGGVGGGVLMVVVGMIKKAMAK